MKPNQNYTSTNSFYGPSQWQLQWASTRTIS